MKKTFPAFAVGACAFMLADIACAQSSLTLYGAIDSGLYYQNRTPNGQGSLIQAMDGGEFATLFGLTGTEDLGGGLTTGFRLENGFSSTTGAISNSNGGIFGREAYVSLGGSFGTFKAGMQYSPFYLAVIASDNQNYPDQASALIPYLNNFGAVGIFNDNSISYTTPTVYGLSGSAMISLGGQAGNFGADFQQSYAVNYSDHGVLAELAYMVAKDPNGVIAQQGRLAGVSYKWGNLKLGGAFYNYRAPTTEKIRNVNVYGIGADYLVTPAIDIHGGVFASRDQDNSANKSMLYGIGGSYFLSKRTSLYAQVGLVHNQGIMGTGLNSQSSLTVSGLPTGNTVGVNFGVYHTF